MSIDNIIKYELGLLVVDTGLNYNILYNLYNVTYTNYLSMGKYDKTTCVIKALEDVKEVLGGIKDEE